MPLVVVASVTRPMSQDGYVRDGSRKWDNPAYNWYNHWDLRQKRGTGLHPDPLNTVSGWWCCSRCSLSMGKTRRKQAKSFAHRWERRTYKYKIQSILQEELQETF